MRDEASSHTLRRTAQRSAARSARDNACARAPLSHHLLPNACPNASRLPTITSPPSHVVARQASIRVEHLFDEARGLVGEAGHRLLAAAAAEESGTRSRLASGQMGLSKVVQG